MAPKMETEIDLLLHELLRRGRYHLRLRAGERPVAVAIGEARDDPLEAAQLTGEGLKSILQHIATTRQIREFRRAHVGEYLYRFSTQVVFRVQAFDDGRHVNLDFVRWPLLVPAPAGASKSWISRMLAAWGLSRSVGARPND